MENLIHNITNSVTSDYFDNDNHSDPAEEGDHIWIGTTLEMRTTSCSGSGSGDYFGKAT